jgi:hypothetical protein
MCGSKGFALWVRMLFSCIVDADFLDTESFMDGTLTEARLGYPALAGLAARFDAYMAEVTVMALDSPVNRLRAEVLAQCRSRAQGEPGLFSLTVPTGGGKTLSSLAFALRTRARTASSASSMPFPTPASSSKPPTSSRHLRCARTSSSTTARPNRTPPGDRALAAGLRELGRAAGRHHQRAAVRIPVRRAHLALPQAAPTSATA